MAQPKVRLSGVVYHPADVAQQYADLGLWKSMSLGDVVRDACGKFADRTALIGPNGAITYREMDEQSDRLAASLLDLGLRPLDPIVFQLPNVPETQIALYACWKAGLLPLCTIAAHREHEIGNLARAVGARAHIVHADADKFDFVAFADSVRGEIPTMEHTIVIGTCDRHPTFESLLSSHTAASAKARLQTLEIDPFQVALFQLSGGSTGLSKIIPRFHSEYHYQVRTWADWSDFDEDTVTLWPLPAMHNAAMACLNTPTHLAGGTVVLMPWSTPQEVFAMTLMSRPSVTGLAAPHIARAKAIGIFDQIDFSFIRQCFSASHTSLIEKEVRVPGYHMFGMSEGLVTRTRPQDPERVRMESVGQAMSPYDEVRIVDPETGENVSPGDVGEMWCRGPYTIRGYYDDPAANAEKFTPDGFLKSGDLMSEMVLDGKRYFVFAGRMKDNIDRGGEKIGAKDIEDAVLQHPDVMDVAAIGMPDPLLGERVCVYIVVLPGRETPSVASMGEFLRVYGLAKYKWPERIEAVPEFPVTKVGKVSKELLKLDIREKLTAQPG